MATHDRGLAGRCDHLMEMHDGRIMSQYPPDAKLSPASAPPPVASAAWHALFWLVFANAVGLLIAILLLFPALNRLLGDGPMAVGSWCI